VQERLDVLAAPADSSVVGPTGRRAFPLRGPLVGGTCRGLTLDGKAVEKVPKCLLAISLKVWVAITDVGQATITV
jgi:hypothetical protein